MKDVYGLLRPSLIPLSSALHLSICRSNSLLQREGLCLTLCGWLKVFCFWNVISETILEALGEVKIWEI